MVDPRLALALGVLLLMLTAIVISSVTAADSPDEDVVLIEDFDDDSTPDVLIADPSGEFGDYSSPGEVEMMLSGGFDEFDNIIFRGETAGDQFGKDVAAADLTGNGLLDLIVGAPLAEVERSDGTIVTDGAAYIFHSPYQTDENGVLYARDADMRVESFFGDADELFGSRVAPLFDITGNNRPEIRALSFADVDVIDLLGGEQITHIYDGETGEFLFAFVTDPDEFNPWQPFDGDVNGDGAVTQADIDIIMANMGMEGPGVTRFDGDLNGDVVVDAIDLGIAMDNFGFYQFEVEWGEDIEPLVFIPGGGSGTIPPPPVWRIPSDGLGCVGTGPGLCSGCGTDVCNCGEGDCPGPGEDPPPNPHCKVEVCCYPIEATFGLAWHCFSKCSDEDGENSRACWGGPTGLFWDLWPKHAPGSIKPDCPGWNIFSGAWGPVATYCGPLDDRRHPDNPGYASATCSEVNGSCNECACIEDAVKCMQGCCLRYELIPELYGYNSNTIASNSLDLCGIVAGEEMTADIELPDGSPLFGAPGWGKDLPASCDCGQ